MEITFSPTDLTPARFDLVWKQMERFRRWTIPDWKTQEDLEYEFQEPENLWFDVCDGGLIVGHVAFYPENRWSAIVHTLIYDRRTRTREIEWHQFCWEVLMASSWQILRAIEDPDNRIAIATLRRLGWSEDGRIRAFACVGGILKDVLLFTLVKEVPPS